MTRNEMNRFPWPWVGLALIAVIAVWHIADFPSGIDPEFPEVERPTFSPYPPPAYRLAEPGDTIDRVGVYLSAVAVSLSSLGWWWSESRPRWGSLWTAALGLSAAVFWYAANPWPTFDGWHGLGWRVVADPDAPLALRWTLLLAAVVVILSVVVPAVRSFRDRHALIAEARRRRVLGLLAVAAVLVLARLAGMPDVEPEGYWPRWALVGGMLLFGSALARCLPPRPSARVVRLGSVMVASGMAAALIVLGLQVIWLHRPLERLRAIVPGRIYISAMPTPEGLEVAQRRHQFKTIINLFQEDLPGLRSPYLDEEIAFVRSHGIHYIRSPLGAARAEGFLDETLRLARDPDAWPILVHCHGCMDRTPAWWGIYAFLYEGTPLREVMQMIEQHRGSRPKGSVTLLYNRVLADRAPERYDDDPTAAVLRRCARGVCDPFYARLESELADQARMSRTSDTFEGSTRQR